MAISYRRMNDIIEDMDILHKDISDATGLSPDTLAKLKNNEPMSMRSLEILRDYLCKVTNKNLQPSDLFEFK